MLDLGATKMSFDRAKVLLVREKEYLKEVKFSMRDQLAVLKVSNKVDHVLLPLFLPQAEEVVLMRILQHHEQAAVSQSSTTPHISSPPPSSQPISNTVSITNPVST